MTKQSYIGVFVGLLVLIGLFFWITKPSATNVLSPDDSNPPPAIKPLDPSLINANWNRLILESNGPPRGNANAPYTLIEIGDFQCPQCGNIKPKVEQLVMGSGGKVKLYFVNFPLPMHPHAPFAAVASLAAAKQGKFWQMYDLLYAHQDELIPSEIEYFSGEEIPGFDVARYKKDVQGADLKTFVSSQLALDNELGVQSTPTFILRSTNGGTPTTYVGEKNTVTTTGLNVILKAPPWMNGGKIPTR